MAVNLYDAAPTDHLFNRIGRGEQIVNVANTHRGTTIQTEVDDFRNLFETQEQDEAEGVYADALGYRAGNNQLLQKVKSILSATVVEQVNRDSTLSQKTLARALKTIITQMIGAGSKAAPDTAVEKRGFTLAVTAGSGNTGDHILLASKEAPDGLDNEYLFTETIRGTLTGKSGAGTTSFTETLAVRGEPAVTDTLGVDWPAGSGVSSTLTSVNPVSSSATNQLVTNGGFDTFTVTDTPDDWTIVAGTVSTHILEESTTVFTGSSLEFASDGSALARISQTLYDPTNSINKISAHNVLCLFFKYRQSAESVGSGTFTVRLIDGSNNQINDDAGNALKLDIDTTASGATAAFINQSAFFSLPKVLPSVVKIEVGFPSDPPDNAISCFIDHMALTKPTLLYKGGIYAQFISGATEGAVGDTQDIAVTKNNDEGGSGNSTGLLQLAVDRFLGIRTLDDPDDPTLTLRIPSVTDGAPEVPDSAIA